MKTYDMVAMLALASVQVGQVATVYSGQPNACCCGCKGTYRYAAAHQAAAGARRGYAVDADEVNDRQVAKVLRMMKAQPSRVELVAEGHFAAILNGRLYMLVTAAGEAR